MSTPTSANSTPSGRWLPHPVLSLILALSWLLLQGTLAVVHVLAALLIGWLLPLLLRPLLAHDRPSQAERIHWRPVPGLVWIVLIDIVRSNWVVARQAVFGRMDSLQPAWFAVPLRLQHPHATSLLALIITNTPGTVSCHIDRQQGHILVHALHCTDVQAVVADINQRYQQPLERIFPTSPAHTPPAAP